MKKTRSREDRVSFTMNKYSDYLLGLLSDATHKSKSALITDCVMDYMEKNKVPFLPVIQWFKQNPKEPVESSERNDK